MQLDRKAVVVLTDGKDETEDEILGTIGAGYPFDDDQIFSVNEDADIYGNTYVFLYRGCTLPDDGSDWWLPDDEEEG